MNSLSIGDLAQSLVNRQHNYRIKSDLQRLAQELASGRKADLATAVTGDYSPVVAIERSLRSNLAYSTATKEADLFVSSMQTSLEMVQETSSGLGPAFLTASSSGHLTLIQTTATDARLKFDAVISSLNTRIANRAAFSGVATNASALADADVILASIQIAVAAETTAAGVVAAVDDWFDTIGGGFETIGYTGSNTVLSPMKLSEGESAEISITAQDPRIRDVLKGYALAALVGAGTLSSNLDEALILARNVGEKFLTADSGLAVLRAEVGSVEAHIETISTKNIAERSALEIAYSDIVSIDPYKVATELEAVQLQLETLYILTSRLSRLSLAEYLR